MTFVLCQLILLSTSNLVFGALENKSIPDFNFAAAGDWRCNPISNQTVNNVVDKDPELVLGLGDFSYVDTADCWLQLIKPLDPIMKIVIGNHDYQVYITNTTAKSTPSLLQEYMDHFNLTKQYYSFDYENIHYVAMSTEIPFDSGSKQYSFVQNDLKKASSNPNVDWIVVFYHRLAYSSPALLDSLPKFRNTYHPLFEKYGVDLVLQGHSHNYQRTFPISYNNITSAVPIITDHNQSNYLNPSGQIFATVGTGGAQDIHRFRGAPSNFTAVQFNAFGFLDIDVLQNGTRLDAKFYENNGTIKDHFTIVKSNNQSEQSDSSLLSSSMSVPTDPSSSPRITQMYQKDFKIETVVKGLQSPTDIAFIGAEDVLALEKNKGTVQRIINGQKLEQPLLDTSVSNTNERGLLGFVVSIAENRTKHVYLYYTEAKHNGANNCPESDDCDGRIDPIGNRLYRYELSGDGSKLVNPELILAVPTGIVPEHNGGKMVIQNNSLYIIIGDIMNKGYRTQNYEGGKEPDGTGGILKVQLDGNNSSGILGNKYPLNLYYAYGIRNGFGLDFDPVTGNLWDTENGPQFGDEINLVKPGFNSGWRDVQGIWEPKGGKAQQGQPNLGGLEDFNGKGKYSDPEFIWMNTVGPTAIKFFNSDKMGPDFRNTLFVGDVHNGNLYHFNLNDDRTALLLEGSIADKVANSQDELNNTIFAQGFAGITDLEIGPDGYLYVLSFGQDAIYRIVPI